MLCLSPNLFVRVRAFCIVGQVDAKVRRLLALSSEQRMTIRFLNDAAESDNVIPNEVLQVR